MDMNNEPVVTRGEREKNKIQKNKMFVKKKKKSL